MEPITSVSDHSLRANCLAVRANAQPLHERFRGALIGLWLAPTALAVFLQRPINPQLVAAVRRCIYHSQQFARNSTHLATSNLATSQPSPTAENLTDLASSPTHPDLSVFDQGLMAAVPGLLRYHDSWLRREQWLRHHLVGLDPRNPPSSHLLIATVLLGDLLELIFSGMKQTAAPHRCAAWPDWPSSLSHIALRAEHYDLSAAQRQTYQTLCHTLSCALDHKLGHRPGYTLYPHTSAKALTAMTGQDPKNTAVLGDFSGAIISALSYPESYALALHRSASILQAPTAAAIAGLLAGASGGWGAIPVLWQLDLTSADRPRPATQFANYSGNRSTQQDDLSRLGTLPTVQAIADQLFGQWAGIASRHLDRSLLSTPPRLKI